PCNRQGEATFSTIGPRAMGLWSRLRVLRRLTVEPLMLRTRRMVRLATKRAFDVSAAALALLCLSPLFLLVGILIKLDSPGAVFFRQERIGRRLQPFLIYKFRTMVSDAPQQGGLITVGNDPRITRVGRLLRRSKFDEMPQLINVLKGEMSIVGPRPEVR